MNAKHLYNICTLLDQRRRRWADVVQMLYTCFVFAGLCGPHIGIAAWICQIWHLLGFSENQSKGHASLFRNNLCTYIYRHRLNELEGSSIFCEQKTGDVSPPAA